MNSRLIAEVVNLAIPLMAGIYMTLAGYGLIGGPWRMNSPQNDRLRFFDRIFKVGGPFLIVFAALQLLVLLFRSVS